MEYVILFISGSVIGSFLNVCIYRLPRREKIGLTRSRCPHCKSVIRWYDNIPLLSFIILRARCRRCGAPISPRYFIVELITAAVPCILWHIYADPVFTAVYFLFSALLIAGSFIDLEFFIIPDVITIPGIAAGFVFSFVFPELMSADTHFSGMFMSFIGALSAGGVLYLIAVAAGAVLKKDAMGMGDVKLLAMIGSFIGWKWALFTIFTASLFGTAAGVILIVLGKTSIKGRIPFGPYLSVGSVVSLLWGSAVISWYLRIFGF